MSDTLPILTLGFEVVTTIFGAVFSYLSWASGYIGYLVRSAKANQWGLKLLREHESGADEWERQTGQ